MGSPSRLHALLVIPAAIGVALSASSCAGESAKSAAGPAQPSILRVAPNGIDVGNCVSAPCATLDYADTQAVSGKVVEIADGTYPDQTIPVDTRAPGSPPVVFRPAPGASVTLGDVDIFGTHVEFQNLRMGWRAERSADELTFRNVSSSDLYIWSATNVRVLGGEVYPGPDYLTGCSEQNPRCDYHSMVTNADQAGSGPPQHILFDHVFFHGWPRPEGSSFHTECLQVGSGIDLTIRRSRFVDCATHDVLIQSWGLGYDLRDITVENNFFAATQDGYFSVNVAAWPDGTYDNIVVRNNSTLQDFGSNVPTGSISFLANIEPEMNSFKCGYAAAATWDYNVYRSGTPCGRHDRIGDPKFVDGTSLDLRIQRGSAAIAHGDPNSRPVTDITGMKRPIRERPDAGAYQYRP